jgi:hypothetical protein
LNDGVDAGLPSDINAGDGDDAPRTTGATGADQRVGSIAVLRRRMHAGDRILRPNLAARTSWGAAVGHFRRALHAADELRRAHAQCRHHEDAAISP